MRVLTIGLLVSEGLFTLDALCLASLCTSLDTSIDLAFAAPISLKQENARSTLSALPLYTRQ